MTHELERCNDKIADTHQAVILLNSLPSQFDNFKDVIQFGNEDLTKKKIIESLIQKNEVMKVFKNKYDKDNKSDVLFTKGKAKNKNKKKGDSSNSSSSDSKSVDSKFKIDKKKVKCHYCGKMGHFISECFKKKKDESNGKSQNGTTAILESQPFYSDELLMCASFDDSNSWILDSGCTMHVTPHKHYFDYLHVCNEGEVSLGDHSALSIKGVGNVSFKMHDGKVRVLQ